jgi:enamine deaminase RidA (YjgF/YER057c/UK114 family)
LREISASRKRLQTSKIDLTARLAARFYFNASYLCATPRSSLEGCARLKESDLAAPRLIGTSSGAVEAKCSFKWLFTAGTLGLIPDGALPADIESQARPARANILVAFDAAGMKSNDLVKLNTALIRDKASRLA